MLAAVALGCTLVTGADAGVKGVAARGGTRLAFDARNGQGRLELAWTDARALGRVRAAGLTTAEWERVLAVYTEAARCAGDPPLSGTYAVGEAGISFRPDFALEPGLTYVGVADLAALARRLGMADPPAAVLDTRLSVPAAAAAGGTRVEAIFPRSSTVPENLLKFYVRFSSPMRTGEAAAHVSLADRAGRRVDQALFSLDREFWSHDRRELTLLLDPGRIKRGLRPNRELGPPLREGGDYVLRIDGGWRDEAGVPLAAAAEKRFTVGRADRHLLDPRTWRLRAPRPGSRDPIEAAAGEGLDQALVRRLVSVVAASGVTIQTTAAMDETSQSIRLTPAEPWKPGAYRVVIDASLEDLAGNNLRRPFDLDRSAPGARPRDDIRTVELPVVIR
jgi:hypothetical protein